MEQSALSVKSLVKKNRSVIRYRFSPCNAPGLPRESSTKTEAIEEEPPIRNDRRPKHKAFPEKVCSAEEDELPPEESEEDELSSKKETLLGLNNELIRMRSRVGELNRLLGTGVSECPDFDRCSDELINKILQDSHPQLLELEISNLKLNQQITELQPLRIASDEAIKVLRANLCKDSKNANQVEADIQKLESFKLTLEKHQALCLQRYRFLEKDKYGGREFEKAAEYFTAYTTSANAKLIHKASYMKFNRNAIEVTKNVRMSAKQLGKRIFKAIVAQKNELIAMNSQAINSQAMDSETEIIST